MPHGGSSSSRRKSHGHGRSGQRGGEFPSEWSEWEWSEEYNRYFRYRQLSDTGDDDRDYEYEYGEESRDPAPIPTYGGQQPASTTTYSSSYTHTRPGPAVDVRQATQQMNQLSFEPATGNTIRRNISYTDTEERQSLLDSSFKVFNGREFKVGRVFKVVWVEPMGQGQTGTVLTNKNKTKTQFGEEGYSSVRRFVVIVTYSAHSVCIPILTYGGRGVGKTGIKLEHHAVIHSKKDPPKTEVKLQNRSIFMKPLRPRDNLDEASLLNFAKPYTVEHNVKVSFVGDISTRHISRLLASYNEVNTAAPLPSQTPRSVPSASYTGGDGGASGDAIGRMDYWQSSTQGSGSGSHSYQVRSTPSTNDATGHSSYSQPSHQASESRPHDYEYDATLYEE